MFGLFGKKKSAKIARDRLTIAIMSDRNKKEYYPFMDDMKTEILQVVQKYIGVKGVEITKEVHDGIEALSIEVELDEVPE